MRRLLLALLVIAAILPGCAGEDADPDEGDIEGAEETTTYDGASARVTVRDAPDPTGAGTG